MRGPVIFKHNIKLYVASLCTIISIIALLLLLDIHPSCFIRIMGLSIMGMSLAIIYTTYQLHLNIHSPLPVIIALAIGGFGILYSLDLFFDIWVHFSFRMKILIELISCSFFVIATFIFFKIFESLPSKLKWNIIIVCIYSISIHILNFYILFINVNFIPLLHILRLIVLCNIYYILDYLSKHYTYEQMRCFFVNHLQDSSQLQQTLVDNDCNINYNTEQLIRLFQNPIVIYKDLHIIYANSTCISLFGAASSNQILQKNINDFIHPESQRLLHIHEDLIKKYPHNIPSLKIKIHTLTGENKDTEFHCLRMTDKKGMPFYLATIQELSNAPIFNEPSDCSYSANDWQMDFFANMSHELKTPINVVYSAVQMQEFYMSNDNLQKSQNYTRMIRQNCLRLIRLINNGLDLKNLHFNSLTPDLVCFNIVEMMENMVFMIRSFIAEKNSSIIFDTDYEEKIIQSDPVLLQRILLNLISNAIKFSKENGHIWLSLYSYDDFITIHVKDDGIGIPKRQQDIIFNEFAQTDPILTRRSEGIGMGLSLVQGLLKILGGTISFISEEGIGSEFIITLNTPPKCYQQQTKTITWNSSSVPLDWVEMEFADIY